VRINQVLLTSSVPGFGDRVKVLMGVMEVRSPSRFPTFVLTIKYSDTYSCSPVLAGAWATAEFVHDWQVISPEVTDDLRVV
jgi:hypothetical protein